MYLLELGTPDCKAGEGEGHCVVTRQQPLTNTALHSFRILAITAIARCITQDDRSGSL